MNKNLKLLSLLLIILLTGACNGAKQSQDQSTWEKPRVPEWHKNATIYEVNMRQYTPEGTFNAFMAHLPRLKEMGVDILWLMPIHPVSKKNRKGELGSPYAVGDYYKVNPRFGTMDDFKTMLDSIHALGMHCIIDWVPNHTGWDNPWITEHPDWYTKDSLGNITDPIDYNTGKSWGWTDVADLNYDNPDMRIGMIDAMKFWITDIGIDGFRVDVAHGVPVDFWEQCTDSLYAIEPVFMLAEAEVPELLNDGSFVMDYAWEMHHLLNDIARYQGANRSDAAKLVQGNLVEGSAQKAEKKTAIDIDSLLAKKARQYHKGYHMQFTSNHDENAWAGTEFERMGNGHLAFAVLTATFNGMPLVYTGQESAMDKQLAFFSKDTVPWDHYKYAGFYKKLFDLKHRNQALWNGKTGGKLVKIPTGNDENIYAFIREKNGDKVVVIINLSSKPQKGTLQGNGFEGTYTDIFNNISLSLSEDMKLDLKPWDYLVYSNN
ncbi:alpha-amylase family glycosyl hydrolase [Saccharicrinis sp. FJH54]|uniref:alpha-amylase family glycosyl hydrolase n=1 Tax=Saccharicrinis sp. FJH54 TaxID=3344665 RepID=UPI0035D41F0B